MDLLCNNCSLSPVCATKRESVIISVWSLTETAAVAQPRLESLLSHNMATDWTVCQTRQL